MDKVVVLLSTYNGEKYLREQLDSLLLQKGVDLKIIIRDDGSIDNTRNILKTYKEKYNNFIISYGNNIGYIKSFMKLVKYSNNIDADYYCFCDQDDIWDNNKIITSLTSIKKNKNEPMLCISSQRIIKDDGSVVRIEDASLRKITKENALLGLTTRGCAMLWNKMLNEEVIKSYEFIDLKKDKRIPSHDYWLRLVAISIGKIKIIPNVSMSYRLSENNAVGSYIGFLGRVKYIRKKFIKYYKCNGDFDIKFIESLYNLLKFKKIECSYLSPLLNYKGNIFQKIKVIKNKKYFEGMTKKWRVFIIILLLRNKI